MLDFQRGPKPRNYAYGHDKWRLFLVIMAVGLGWIIWREAGNPQNWGWFRAAGDGAAAGPAAPGPGREGPIDNRLPMPPVDEEVPGTFFSPLDDKPAEGPEPYFPGVKPTDLETVRDDATFRYEEREAWFNLLQLLRQNEEAVLRRGSLGRVTYAQLFKQASEYRGRLVTVEGSVRRVFYLRAPKNDYGIEGYYQVWLQPTDNPTSPLVVYCLELPKDFPTGMSVSAEVEIVGFFFKRWAYRAKDSLRTAPTLLARTVVWRPAPEAIARPAAEPGSSLPWIAAVLGMSVLVMVYVYLRTRSVPLAQRDLPSQLGPLGDVTAPSEAELPRDRADSGPPTRSVS